MNARVQDLMTESVVVTERHKTVDHVRKIMEKNKISAVPVVDDKGHPVGIVSATDLVAAPNPASPVSAIMTRKVYTVAGYDDVSVAARVMRNHRIHHLVVTHEQKVAGFLSSFDLLKLVEDHRFVAKNPPTPSSRHGSKRS